MYGVHEMGYPVPVASIGVGMVGLVAAVMVYFLLRWRGWGRVRAALAVAAGWMYLAVLAIGLSPSSNSAVVGSCAIGEIDMLGWLDGDQRLLNVLMYLLLTVFGLLAADTLRLRVMVLVVLTGTPPLVEGLGRSCDVHDVLDNWVGVFVGAMIAGFVLFIVRSRSRRSITSPATDGACET